MLHAAAVQRLAPAACEALLLLGPPGPACQSWPPAPCNLQKCAKVKREQRERQGGLNRSGRATDLQAAYNVPRQLHDLPSFPHHKLPRSSVSPTCIHGQLARLAKAQPRLPLANAHVSG